MERIKLFKKTAKKNIFRVKTVKTALKTHLEELSCTTWTLNFKIESKKKNEKRMQQATGEIFVMTFLYCILTSSLQQRQHWCWGGVVDKKWSSTISPTVIWVKAAGFQTAVHLRNRQNFSIQHIFKGAYPHQPNSGTVRNRRSHTYDFLDKINRNDELRLSDYDNKQPAPFTGRRGLEIPNIIQK